MGLWIRAYRQIKPAPGAKVGSDGRPADGEKYFFARKDALDFTEKNWPGRSGGIRPGVYSFAEKVGFQAGPYSFYNWWRDQLCLCVHALTAEQFWKGPKTGAFAELIYFADDEGVIGAAVARKLAQDFAENEELAEEYAAQMGARGVEDSDGFPELYRNWRKAFELASDGGAVEFC